MLAAGQVMAASAAPVALTGRSDWPVLVATRTLDVGVLAGIAERARASLAISDGHRLLVGTAAGPGAAPTELGPGPLEQALDLPAPGVGIYGGVAVAVLPLGGGLHILAGQSAPAAIPGAMPLPGVVLAVGLVLAIALGLSLGSFFLLARRATDGGAPIVRGDDGRDRSPSSAATRSSIASASAGWPRSTRRSPPAKGAFAARW